MALVVAPLIVGGVKRRATTLVLAAAVLIAATHTSSASAAEPVLATVDIIDNEIEDGIYTGNIYLTGGFSFPTGDDGIVLVRNDIDGEAQITAQGGAVTGSWTYDGTGVAFIQGLGVNAQADTVFTGQGTFEGTNTAVRVLGETMFTGTVTANGTTQPIAGSAPTDQPLENVLAGCGQIVGTYTQRINAQIQAEIPEGQSNIRGVIALYSDPPTPEAEQLAERASELRADPEEDPFQRIFAATTLLREVQELQAELNATSSCPSTKEYFNLLTNVAGDLIADALSALEALEAQDAVLATILAPDVLRFLVTMGVSTGATGSGAVGGRGAELLPAIRERAQASVDLLLGDVADFDLDALARLAVLSVQYDWDLTFGEVTAEDVLNTAGEDVPDAEVDTEGGEG